VTEYEEFIASKSQLDGDFGFAPTFMPSQAFDFQAALIEWACRKGRGALYCDCGLGKSLMQLAWAENVVRKSNGRVLVLTPLAVGAQTVKEGAKFGIEAAQCRDGKLPSARIVVTNYEKLHMFDAADFAGCVCDESSILKSMEGATRHAITEFMRMLPYRLLCTATPAPNDYIELGTSSEAVGALGCMDMLSRFFKRDESFCRRENMGGQGWRFRGHSQRDFWRWVCSWARAMRMPSDLGFDNGPFVLPALSTREHIVKASTVREGFLFDLPAAGLHEQREERRRTIAERCELAASLATHSDPVIAWCHLNDEGDLLENLIPGAVQVSGADADEAKEEAFAAFVSGQARALVTKPTIAGFGLNFQHCAHMTFFPSHSFEQWYQSIRRCWRFGQRRKVAVDMVASEGEAGVVRNLTHKADAAALMFARLVELMNDELKLTRNSGNAAEMEMPSWL
jgi:hypothetical protein